MSEAEIGILGGSGLYTLLDDCEEIDIDTPYGKPSDKIAIGEMSSKKVAFIPRHGKKHSLPPHSIPYRANIWALHKLGVSRIIAPAAVGSLQPNITPGTFVICDQFVDRTNSRKDTFYDGAPTTHIAGAEPYCPILREVAYKSAKKLKINVEKDGTVVIVQGPRFSTKAESIWFKSLGWHVINMTQYPEVVLARELELCYVNVSLVTDYDVGLDDNPDIKPVSKDEVVKVFSQNIESVKKLLYDIVKNIPDKRNCLCSHALSEARF